MQNDHVAMLNTGRRPTSYGPDLSLKEFLSELTLLPIHNAGLQSAGKTYGVSTIQCCGLVY